MKLPRPGDGAAELSVTRAQFAFAKTFTQILVYVVVLNLFVEYVHTVVIDSFTVSLLTAVLLWLILQAVVRLEHRASAYFTSKPGVLFRVLRYLSVWAILFLSKFVILEAVALITRGRAELGQFIEVVVISLVLLAADAVLRRVYDWLGRFRPAAPDQIN